jgi:hypothetical protein
MQVNGLRFQLSIGRTHKKIWEDFREYAASEVEPISNLVIEAISDYGPFIEWRRREDGRLHRDRRGW